MRNLILLSLLCSVSAFAAAQAVHVRMPNPLLTPGEVRTTSLVDVCHSSTKEFRHTTAQMKRDVCTMYREKDCPHEGIMELDHLIPLELGGADTEANLWPQPAKPIPGFHEKDKLENRLHQLVCSNKLGLADAQAMIRTDWYAAFKQYVEVK